MKQLVAPLLFERNTIKFTREVAYEIFENGLEISYYSERQSRSDIDEQLCALDPCMQLNVILGCGPHHGKSYIRL